MWGEAGVYHVSLAVQSIYGWSDERSEDWDGKEGIELSGGWERVENPDDMVLCGESEEDLRVMVGRFTEVCRRRGLKVSAGKSKVMVLNGDE